MFVFRALRARVLFFATIVVVAATLPLSAATASAAGDNRCSAGQSPHYVLGFASLHDALGDQMDQPITCEFADPNGTGDVHQQTTRGLAFWRKSTNTPTFTNGYDHWAFAQGGMVHWIGSSIDPPAAASLSAPQQTPQAAAPSAGAAPADANLRATVGSAARDVSAFWSRTMPTYTPVDLFWYSGRTKTGCGTVDSQGPFYCGADHAVYLDTPFFESLWKKGWTFGLEMIVAHEIGHHVQRLAGLRVVPLPDRPGQVFGINAELGADCLAGVWANDAYTHGRATKNDIVEASDITSAAGDPAGTPWYAPDAHGSSKQRTSAFMLGVKDGNPRECLAV